MAREEFVNAVTRDLRLALRGAFRHPWVSVMVVGSLMLAVAATTSTFAIINGVLLQSLPVRDQRNLVVLWGANRIHHADHVPLPSGLIEELHHHVTSLSSFASVQSNGASPFAAVDGDRLVPLQLSLVSSNFFAVLGVQASQGRLLEDRDDEPGEPRRIVLSYHAWSEQFGHDPAVVGRTVRLMGVDQQIVGVAPRSFEYPKGTEVWASLAQAEHQLGVPTGPTQGFPCDIVGRLRPGHHLVQASQELSSLLRASAFSELGEMNEREGVATPFTTIINGDDRPILFVLVGAVCLVLAIASINSAALLLARGTDRQREVSLRVALGARKAQILIQLGIENGMLVALAACLGTVLSVLLLRKIVSLAPTEVVLATRVQFDWASIAFAFVLGSAVVMFVGWMPALASVREHLSQELSAGSRTSTSGPKAGRARKTIVVSEVALALVVLAGAGLLGRSLQRLEQINTGFATKRLLFVGLQLVEPISTDSGASARLQARFTSLVDQLRARAVRDPNLGDVTLVSTPPFASAVSSPALALPEGDRAMDQRPVPVDVEEVLENYFDVLDVKIQRGRSFTEAERRSGAKVVVVNQAFARRAWSGVMPQNARIRFVVPGATLPSVQIVGVSADAQYRTLGNDRPTVYVAVQPESDWPAYAVVRGRQDPRSMLPEVRNILAQSDRGFGIREIRYGNVLLQDQLARPRFLATVVIILAFVAVILSATGLFGVVSTHVQTRSREMAIRMALGSTPAGVRARLMREGMLLASSGIAIGVALSLASTRMLRAILFDVSPTDPLTLAAVAICVSIIALGASMLPTLTIGRGDLVEQLQPD